MNILIYYDEGALNPVGGPSGYLYNLQREMIKQNDSEITFKKENAITNVKRKIKKYVPKVLINKYQERKNSIPFSTHIEDIRDESNMGHEGVFHNYDVVHFHNTFEMYRMKYDLRDYQGLVLLTSHSPKVYYREIIEDVISVQDYHDKKNIYDSAEEFDEYAFKRADYIIFPCPGAEEPYYHSWPMYKEIRDEKKIRYVPTGISPVNCKKTREEIRKELNIPLDATVLSFVGRHNEVKGYDILQDIFSKLNNVYVVCCGMIGDIQPPESNRWIEVGWTTDPYSYVGAADIYMLPNRETYFDIAMLQTLSIGKCSVISNTGGNKEFTNTPGVKLYNSEDEAVECIKQFIDMDTKERNRLENLQRKEFNEKYTIENFYEKYKETIKKLIEDR